VNNRRAKLILLTLCVAYAVLAAVWVAMGWEPIHLD
jgi:hypothetical protein